MSKPYGIISDLHLFNWQAFSHVNEDKLNNRLVGLLAELVRCGEEIIKAGGDTLFCAGDLFHVRGSITPSVLNPTREAFRKLKEMGVQVKMIPGNHDLEGKDSDIVGSAVNLLSEDGIVVVHEPKFFEYQRVIMLPWYDNLDTLRAQLADCSALLKETDGEMSYDVIIHAPLNNVIVGLPDRGLTTEELLSYGFKRIFAGHYHNHKMLTEGYKITSVGALAHHSWSDVGSKAGFLIVYDKEVRWMKSHLPEFVDITPDMTEADAELAAEGNYVRAHIINNKMTTVETIRDWMIKSGAKGVIIKTVKDAKITRDTTSTATVSTAGTIQESIANYIKSQFTVNQGLIDIECQKILAEASV